MAEVRNLGSPQRYLVSVTNGEGRQIHFTSMNNGDEALYKTELASGLYRVLSNGELLAYLNGGDMAPPVIEDLPKQLKPPLDPCTCCGGKHCINSCSKFRSMSVTERCQLFEQKQICANCCNQHYEGEQPCVGLQCPHCAAVHSPWLCAGHQAYMDKITQYKHTQRDSNGKRRNTRVPNAKVVAPIVLTVQDRLGPPVIVATTPQPAPRDEAVPGPSGLQSVNRARIVVRDDYACYSSKDKQDWGNRRHGGQDLRQVNKRRRTPDRMSRDRMQSLKRHAYQSRDRRENVAPDLNQRRRDGYSPNDGYGTDRRSDNHRRLNDSYQRDPRDHSPTPYFDRPQDDEYKDRRSRTPPREDKRADRRYSRY